MVELVSIVQALSPAEAKLVKHFYKLKKYGEQKKRSDLFDLIFNKKVLTDESASKALGYSPNSSAFINLKVRLKSDVMSILLMQECSSKFSTPYAQAMFSCKRSLMQGEILMSRGIYDEALEMLRKAAKQARKFELYGEQVLIEDLARNHLALRNKVSDFEEISGSIEDSYNKLGQLLKVKRKHYEINIPGLLAVNNFEEYKNKGMQIMEEISQVSNMSSSSRVQLFHDLTSLHYFSSVHDFSSAQQHAVRLLKAVETDTVVMSKSNQAGVNMELANIYLNVGKYEKAIEHSSNAVDLFKPGMINQLHSYIILFFSYFRNNDFKNASKTIETALEHRLVKSQEHSTMVSRLHLLRAGLAFSEGDYEHSSAILRENSELVQDKEGWMPGYFLLESLILLEKEEVDLATFKIESFRKLLRRHGLDKKELRIWEITRLLRQLVRDNCDYPKLLKKQNENISMLSEAKANYYWNPASYEVIRFDQWLMKKSFIQDAPGDGPLSNQRAS